jgi:hypothetical protein
VKTTLVLAIATLLALSFAIPVEAAGFTNIVLSATKDGGTAQSNFPIDTPVIYVSADLADVLLDLGRLPWRRPG